ncbi:HET-domain-containing protein [Melanomma pulvis-pyrius CBS 109.77]|uniref:HET-domain-containing protein n=1 Tax=Melanomma pulvis-pyrius CBS 109.77 TaxID=1314802 RepID=A0A6A6WTQ2_9PLEO|nr:HET-domain-containing protein [Melanomma pulvis-pyrius CBS 109.77]
MTTPNLKDAVPPGHQFPREIRSALLEYDKVDKEIGAFKYEKLPAGRKRIRLLRLSPGVLNNPQIDCEMFEAEFNEHHQLITVEKQIHGQTSNITQQCNRNSITREDEKKANDEDVVKYEALSWRWGDEDNSPYTIMIKKNGARYKEQLYKKRVSRTLGLALKYLRLPAKDRILWIDAICIHQADGEERSFQVSMMSLVYTRADEVCVWLGEDDDDSTRAIKFIENEVSKLKNFDALCKDKEHAADWGALLVLMQRDWFSRRWVVQEITLARKATVYCGPECIKWRDLAIAVELFVEVETATHRLSELMKKDDKFALVPYWFEHISELGASLLVNATARIYRDYQRDQDGSLTDLNRAVSRRSLLSLEYLVTSLSIFDCGRPHDSVYALVAIARDAAPQPPTSITERTKDGIITAVFSDQLEQKPYPLDYTSPYPDVCKEFIHFCIERAAKADPLQALDILCRPWAKDWRPKHPKPDTSEKSDSKEGSKTESDAQKKTMIKHNGPWMISKDVNKSSRATAHPLFHATKSKVEDSRSCQQYFKDSEREPVNHLIKKWFREPASTETPKDEQMNEVQRPERRKTRKEKRGRINEKKDEEKVVRKGHLMLPSWVARITDAPFDIFLHPGMDMVKMGRKNADPLVGIPQDGHRNYSAGQSNGVDMKSLKFRKRARLGHYSLYVKGFCVDRVKEVAQVSQGGAIPATWLDMAGWSKARRFGSFDSDPGDPPDSFWRTLVADRGRYDRNPPYYYARACKETIMKGGLRSNAVNTTDLIYNERNSIIAEFCRRVQAVIWNRALIRTEKDLLGLVSDKVKEGDLICIIYGCTVPIILRKERKKTEEDLENEKCEDFAELMKRLMTKCEKARSRKAQYREGSEEWVDILNKRKNKENVNRDKVNGQAGAGNNDKKLDDRRHKKDAYVSDEDDLSEDESEEEVERPEASAQTGSGDEQGKSGIAGHQKQANERDPYRHYKFLGEAYIHGMMDGEAVREKFYKLKPDHMFELR